MSEWVEWHGGENPVPGKMVEVRLRTGDEFTGSDLSDHATWKHIWGDGDIIAYRIAGAASPAPEKLALAVEALEPFAGLNVIDPGGVIVGLERWHFDRARQALAAIKAST